MAELDVADETTALDEMPELADLVISPRVGPAATKARSPKATDPAFFDSGMIDSVVIGSDVADTDVADAGRADESSALEEPTTSIFVGERFPTLEIATPRLLVRRLTAADAAPVEAIFGDRVTRRWLPVPQGSGAIDGRSWCTEMAAERRAMGAGDHFGMIRREDDRLVGILWTKRTDWPARSTEICVAVDADSRGYGFAAEALDGMVVELVTQHGFQRIEMRVAAGDTSSRRVAEKAGFSYEGVMRNAGTVRDGRVDLHLWSLVAADLR